MSSLPNNMFASPGNSYFALKGEIVGAQDWWQYPSQNGEIQLIDSSGTQLLQSIGADLFYNNELLAKADDIQDIADWSLYPALSNVNMNGQSLADVSSAVINNTLLVRDISANTIGVLSLTTSNVTASSLVQAGSISSTGAIAGASLATTGGLDMTNSSITRASSVNISNSGFAPYGALTSPNGVLLTWNGATITTGAGGDASQWANYPAVTNVNVNSNNITNAQDIYSVLTQSRTLAAGNATNGTFVTVTSNMIQGSTTQPLTVASQAGQPLALSSGTTLDVTVGTVANINSGNDFNVTCDGGLNPLITPAVSLTAQNGNGGQVNLTADPGSVVALGGAINIKANGGQVTLPTDPPTTITVGGIIELDANTGIPGGIYTATSAIKMNAAGINSYAGAIPSVGSLAGYNFIYGSAGVSLCAGLPASGFQLPLTTYIYGVGSLGFTGVRLESPNGIGMLSPVYATNLYPFDGNNLVIQGRSAPNANVTIEDCDSLTMTGTGTGIFTDRINSVSNSGILYSDSFRANSTTQGLFTNFIKPSEATAPGAPNLVISNNPFGGNNNYVEISGADVIAFAATGAGALTGIQSINGAAWPPATGDASLWSQYPATSVIDVSGYGLTRVGDLSGVININGSAYPPVVSSDDWSLYPALQAVDMSGFGLTQLASIATPNGFTITSAGSIGIFADTSSGNISIATNSGGSVNIGTGNAGDINIQTIGAGNDLNLAGDTASITAAVKLNLDTPIIDVVGADIQNVSNITNEATNLLTVQSTANLTVSAETALTLVSDSADVTVQGQTGVSVYAATGNVSLTADSGEVIVQDSVLNMNTHKITNLTNGTAAADAVNYGQLTFRDSTEFYVSGQGSDSNNGSILAPFLTIQAAITAAELISSASSICSINVASGNYPQSLTFNKGYVVLNGTLQSQTGNEVCEITGSITINCVGANDVFNRQVAFQGFNITCGAGQSITNTSTSSHTVSFQDCKIFVNSVCYNSTATCADARTYFTNVEIYSTNAANVSPVITTNVGLVELERLDLTVDGNAIGVLIGGTSVLSRFSLSTLENTNTGATLLPLLSFTSTTNSPHSLGNVAFAFTAANAKTNTNAVYINSGVGTAIIALNCVFTLAGTASSTNNCIGYNGVGSPTIAGINNTSLNINVLLPQTVSVQSGITQIQYTNIQPPGLACYSSTADQPIAIAGTPQALTYTTTQFNQGTTLVANSRIYANAQGNYALSYSVELQHAGGGSPQLATIFLKKNGTTIANTGRQWTMASGSTNLAAASEFVVSLNAGDYVEVFFNGDTNLSANATAAAGALPAIPSVVFNIKQFR